MKKLLAFIFLTSLVVYAGLPPTTLKGGNEASLQTTFQFDLGQIPVTRTGSNVVFGTIPVTQGGTSSTTLTQYGLLAGNGTAAVQTVSPGASGTILFSNGASAFPSYRLLTSNDVTTALGYTPLASSSTWATSGTAVYYNTGNVGIGISSPASALDVGATGVSGGVANFGNGGASLSNFIQINNRALFGLNTATSNTVVQGIAGRGIEFNVNNSTFGSGQAMVITASGSVGVGITAPTASLDVSSTARIRGLTTGLVVSNSTGNLSVTSGVAGQYLVASSTATGGVAFTSAVPSVSVTTVTSLTTSSTGTFTTPTGARQLRIKIAGAGGGGSGGGVATPGSGVNGEASTFGTNLLTANGGNGGVWSGSSYQGGNGGGTMTVSGATTIYSQTGGQGYAGTIFGGSFSNKGGDGGSTPFGGGGAGGTNAAGSQPTACGAGGGAGGSNSAASTGGGRGAGAGAYAEVLITSPAASYSYKVGGKGTGGTAGGNGFNGGDGQDGCIIIETIY